MNRGTKNVGIMDRGSSPIKLVVAPAPVSRPGA